jgi:hypothetical protein
MALSDAQKIEGLLRVRIRDPKLRKLYRPPIENWIKLGLANGSLLTFEKKGRIRAGIWEFSSIEHFPGVKSRIIEFALMRGDKTGKRWLQDELKLRSKNYNDKTFTFLPPSGFWLLDDFKRLGFSIESVALAGNVSIALSALMKKHRPPRDLSHLGLTIRKVTRAHIRDVQGLHRREFTRNPQHGFFVAKKTYLDTLKRETLLGIKDPAHSHYVILRGKKVVGFFAATTGFNQLKGRAGVTFVFDQSIQGLGIVKTAYRILLEDMRRRKIETFMGGTSQKAVLGLGKLMKRRPQFYILRYGRGHFNSRHFGSW